MTINPDAGRFRESVRASEFQEARTLRRAELEGRIQEATLAPARQLSPGEIQEHQGFSNGIICDCDRLKEGRLGGLLGNFGCLTAIFETPAEGTVREATTPHMLDNDKARDVKDEYRRAMAEARQERAQADKVSRKLGPGPHTLSNGDQVDVKQDPDTGRTTVTTKRPDGSSKTVEYDARDRDDVSVTRTSPFGDESSLEQHGTTVTRAKGGPFQEKTSTRYHVDGEGRPVREERGPEGDDYEKTTVNDDGSTEQRRLIYRDDEGRPVFEDSHDEPGFPGFPSPEPSPFPHPLPGPFPHPEPIPFPPMPGPFPHPEPLPFPHPTPGPFPHPEPLPFPHPTPGPFPHPEPIPFPPMPGPFPHPEPLPFPHPTPGPFPHPEPIPFPPLPGPFPHPLPGPFPHPEPIPFPHPEPLPLPNPWRPLPGPFPWEGEGGWGSEMLLRQERSDR